MVILNGQEIILYTGRDCSPGFWEILPSSKFGSTPKPWNWESQLSNPNFVEFPHLYPRLTVSASGTFPRMRVSEVDGWIVDGRRRIRPTYRRGNLDVTSRADTDMSKMSKDRLCDSTL